MLTSTNSTAIRSQYFTTKTAAFSPEAFHVEANFLDAVNHFTSTITNETPAKKFARLTSTWKSETQFSSIKSSLLFNRSYQSIIAMGREALPFIFQDLKKGPSHWFLALAIITGANPVSPEIRGNISEMTNAWLRWGRENGYVT